MEKAKKLQPQKASKEGVIYALDTSALQVGDIILLSQKGLASWAIRLGTRSKVSHAAILTRPGILMEAQPEGVRRRSTLGTYATRMEWITVLRPKFALGTNSRGVSLAECAEMRYGWAYSKIRAVGSALPVLSDLLGWHDGTFCSELVVLSFADYGIDLLPGVKRSSVTPDKLKKSKLVEDVTIACVRALHPVNDSNEYNLVKRIQERDEPKLDMELERQCFDELRRVQPLPPTVRSIHEAFVWLASLDMRQQKSSAVDAKFVEVLEGKGYFSFYEDSAEDLMLGGRPFLLAIATVKTMSSDEITQEHLELLTDLKKMLPTFEENFNARVDSVERSSQLAVGGSKALAKVFEVQERMAAQALILRGARLGLVKELELAALRKSSRI